MPEATPWDVQEQERAGIRIRTVVDDVPSLVPIGRDVFLPQRYRLTADKPGLPLIHMTVELEYGRPTCQELKLERRQSGSPITTAVMREISVATILRESVAV